MLGKNQECNLFPNIAELGFKLIFVTFYEAFHDDKES